MTECEGESRVLAFSFILTLQKEGRWQETYRAVESSHVRPGKTAELNLLGLVVLVGVDLDIKLLVLPPCFLWRRKHKEVSGTLGKINLFATSCQYVLLLQQIQLGRS